MMNYQTFQKIKSKITKELCEHLDLLQYLENLCKKNAGDEELEFLAAELRKLMEELENIYVSFDSESSENYKIILLEQQPKFAEFVFKRGLISTRLEKILLKYN
jgi:hypothetical protein